MSGLCATPWTVPARLLCPLDSPGQNTGVGTFSRGSSQPRDQTQVSHIAGRFFTTCATKDAQESWGGRPIPSPADPPNPGINLGSPVLQADSLPSELSGKPFIRYWTAAVSMTSKSKLWDFVHQHLMCWMWLT